MNINSNIIKIFCSCTVITIVYAIVHDQIAFTISSDFFYRYSFYQYGIASEGLSWIPPNPRLEVFKLSLYSSWWIGIILGLVICFVGFSDRNKSLTMSDFRRSFFIGILITILTSTIGATLGLFSNPASANPIIYFESTDATFTVRNFRIVSYMDTFSYIGGAIATVCSCIIIYHIRRSKPNSQ